MRFQRVLMASLGVILLALASPLFPQQGVSELRGRVLDQEGAALPGVTVVAKNQATGMYRQTVTDKDGVYFLAGIVPGIYELSADLSGFQAFKRRDVRLEIGKTITIDMKMRMAGVAETLTVTAAAPIVDVTSKEVGGNITAKELVELPSINRNFVGFVGLLPGVVASISTESFGSDSVSVNGEDPRNNNYMVDGGNNNDDVIGQRAGTQARTPIEAIQEFQVLTGQYDAEFGRTSGAIVNAITKQGTNDFDGVLFGFMQDKKFTQKDFFAKQLNRAKPDTKFIQYGGTLGGPIIRDRLHFFVSYERPMVDRGTTINIPSHPELSTPTTTQDRVINTMVRFDGQLNASNHGAVRWLREESPQQNQIIDFGSLNGTLPVTLNANREESDVDQTAVAHFDSVLGNAKLNTLRLTFTQEDVAFANAGFNGNGQRQDLLPPTLVFRTFVDQQSPLAQARLNNAYYIEDAFSWYVNKHDLKAGVQLARLTDFSTSQDNANGIFTFATDKPFNANDFSTYPERLQIRVPGPQNFDVVVKSYSGYLQDKWSVTDRFTASMGLRYDLERIPINEVDNPRFSNSGDYPEDTNNISPRVGFSYNVGNDRPTVLRGGVGRFYDKTHLELITAIITNGVFSTSFTQTFPNNAADPGPSRGERPTNPFLANGPVVDRTLLAQMFPAGTKIKNTGTVTFDSPDRVIPYTDQISLGAQREIANGLGLSLDLIHAEGRDQFMRRELNPATRADTTRTGRITRPDPNFAASVLEVINTGRIKYDAAQFQLDHHLGQSYQYRVSYTYSRSRGNTSGNGAAISNVQVGNDLNLDLNEGPTDFDRTHNLTLSAAWRVPHTGGLTLSTITRYLSGAPFTINDTNVDPDRNGILFDPLPKGTYTGTGRNAITVFNKGGRNGARGPNFLQADVRVGYSLPLATTRLEVFGEIFNVTDRANFDNPTGDRRSPNFLVLTALRPGGVPRTGQLGARLVF